MAAGANLSANNNGSTSNGNDTFTTNNKIINSGRSTVPENSAVGPSERALMLPFTVTLHWSRVEQSLMEELLPKYASNNRVIRYAKIATKLNGKTAHDVALRHIWMTVFQKKENGKRRQGDGNLSKRRKDKREKVADENGKAYAQISTSVDDYDGIPHKYADIGGELGHRFEQNEQAMHQISANFSALKVHENISLFSQTRNNIIALLNELNDCSIKNMPDLMKRMPPLSLKVNDELVISVLNQSSMPMKF